MRISVFFRRFVCCLMVCLLLIPAALADTINLSSLSDAEIVDLLNRVNAEIVSRGISKTAKLPQGAYIAGKDLPAGKYILTVMATGNDWGNVTVYTEEGKGKQVLLRLDQPWASMYSSSSVRFFFLPFQNSLLMIRWRLFLWL